VDFAFSGVVGLGSGAIIGFIALSAIIVYKATGVINLAQGALAMYAAYVFLDLRNSGRYLIPIPGLPAYVQIGPKSGMDLVPALSIALATGALLGFLLYWLVFRPMRGAPPLAHVAASVGVLLLIESIVAFRYGTGTQQVPAFLPETATLHLFGGNIPDDRLITIAVLLVVSVGVWALYRYTPFGVSTRAAAENERAMILLGYSPNLQAAVSCTLAGLISAMGGILSSQITGVSPSGYTLLIIPALAAALAGRLQSIGVTVAVSLGIGAAQSILANLSTVLPWWPAGTQDALPFVLIAILAFAVGRSLPTRGSELVGRLPRAPRPGPRLIPALIGAVIVGTLIFVLPLGWRSSLMLTMIGAILALSLVVLTGYVGQISLFQLSLAGASAYLLAWLSSGLGIPFPLPMIIAALGAALFGLIAAIPATRIRGISLAIVTLAFGYALETTIFNSPTINGNLTGVQAAPPVLFGLDLSFTSAGQVGRPIFGIFVLVILVLVALAVANLRRGRTGRRMLAVRSDEQAAAAAGIGVIGTKLLGFAVAGFIAGIGGALMAYQQSAVNAASFATVASIAILAAAYLGGISSVPGAMVAGTLAAGGLSFYLLQQLIFQGLPNGLQLQNIIAGLALILMAIFNPEGVAGATSRFTEWLRRKFSGEDGRKAAKTDATEGAALTTP
jgi:ABC-type branched-subunit amino acid transport system permease subunit